MWATSLVSCDSPSTENASRRGLREGALLRRGSVLPPPPYPPPDATRPASQVRRAAYFSPDSPSAACDFGPTPPAGAPETNFDIRWGLKFGAGHRQGGLILVPTCRSCRMPAHGYLFRRPLSSRWWMLYLSTLDVVEPLVTHSGRVRTGLTRSPRSRKVTRMRTAGGALVLVMARGYHPQPTLV